MRACLLFVLLIAQFGYFPANVIADSGVTVTEITAENWSKVVPAGKETDAIIGDYVLQNKHVTAVIAQPLATRNANMTVRNIAGCLIDFTTTENSNDQLSAYYPGSQAYPFRDWKIVFGDEEVALNQHQIHSPNALEVQVTAQSAEGRAELTVIYRLTADQRFLEVEQLFRNPTDAAIEVSLSDDVRLDGGKEDMLKSPNGEHGTFFIDDRFWQQAYLLQPVDEKVSSRSDARRSVLRYGRGSRQPDVKLKPGEEFSHLLHWYVGKNLADLNAELARKDNQPVGSNAITILSEETQTRLPGVRIELKKEGQYAGTLWTDGSGRVDQKLPVGEYQAEVTFLGRSLIGTDVALSVQEGTNIFDLQTSTEVGTLQVRVQDENGRKLPAKVELIAKDGQAPLNFGPETATTQVKNLLYVYSGKHDVLIPTGEYEVIVSHGPEYDATFTDTTIAAEEISTLETTLKRVVDTTGWISTEYHSHSTPSGDNTGSQLGRVMNLVCEHLEFAPCTEHNRIDTYAPHIKSLGIEQHLASCTGMELTGSPLPLNHQNVFPLKHVPMTQDGGGPVTDQSPETQIQRVALWDDRSEKFVQQNHPDIGWLFYDKDGDGTPDGGYAQSHPFIDAMEIHPLPAIIEYANDTTSETRIRKNRIFNWLQLLNQGYRITGVVNTDAHYNFHGSGGLRNWVKSSTDNPAEIDTSEMVTTAEQGHLVMSNGPFLTASFTDTEIPSTKPYLPGDALQESSGKLNVDVKVQCPNWFDVDRVFLLVNGKYHPQHDYTREKNPELFSGDVVKFQQTWPVELKEDAHLIVVTVGENSQLGPVMGPSWGKQQPVAITNPIFVDVDGNGFQPSMDPIDDGLPVKGE